MLPPAVACRDSLAHGRAIRRALRSIYHGPVLREWMANTEARRTTREILRALRALRRQEEAGILGIR